MFQDRTLPSTSRPLAPPLQETCRDYVAALLDGARPAATELIMGALESGADLRDVYLHVLQPAQHELGRLWALGEIDIGTEHLATSITQAVMAHLYPLLFAHRRVGRRLVGACVEGELHELGLRMVCDFFELEGWDTFYLGASTPGAGIVAAAAARQADVLALSASRVEALASVRAIVAAVRAAPGCERMRILVGGLAFSTPDRWREVGADGQADDALAAVAVANGLLALPAAPLPPVPAGAPGEEAPAPAWPRDTLTGLSRVNSEIVNAQRLLAKQRSELERLGAERNRLMGMLAHDLRNPLSVILTYSRFLGDEGGASPQERAEFVQAIESSSRFMLALVNEALELSALTEGKLPLKLERVDLTQASAAVVRLNAPLAQRKGIGLRFEGSPGECAVDGDARQLQQVVTNLLTNAWKYSPPDSEITVRVAARGDRAVLEVQDRGIGISAEEQARLFQPFGALRQRGTQGERSTGLGLFIVRRILDGHGGEISVDSRLGAGSTFRVSLPLARPRAGVTAAA